MAHQGNSKKPGEEKSGAGVMGEERKREAFRTAANNITIDWEFMEKCEQADLGAACPAKWDDNQDPIDTERKRRGQVLYINIICRRSRMSKAKHV